MAPCAFPDGGCNGHACGGRVNSQLVRSGSPRISAIMAEHHHTAAETKAFFAGALADDAAVTLNNAISHRYAFCDDVATVQGGWDAYWQGLDETGC